SSLLLASAVSGQWKVMWSPSSEGCPHSHAGVSTLPTWWSQLRCGPRFVRIQVYALQACLSQDVRFLPKPASYLAYLRFLLDASLIPPSVLTPLAPCICP